MPRSVLVLRCFGVSVLRAALGVTNTVRGSSGQFYSLLGGSVFATLTG